MRGYGETLLTRAGGRCKCRLTLELEPKQASKHEPANESPPSHPRKRPVGPVAQVVHRGKQAELVARSFANARRSDGKQQADAARYEEVKEGCKQNRELGSYNVLSRSLATPDKLRRQE